jgi:hypothetical protein
MISTAHQICSGDEIEKNDMGWVCGREEVHTGFWWGNLRERDHLGDLGVDGWLFSKFSFVYNTGCGI